MAVNVDKSIVYKASQAKDDAMAFWEKPIDKKAEEILNLIYSGIKSSFTTGSKTFNQTDMMLGTKKQFLKSAVSILYLVQTNLTTNGYTVTTSIKDGDGNVVDKDSENIASASITVKWATK